MHPNVKLVLGFFVIVSTSLSHHLLAQFISELLLIPIILQNYSLIVFRLKYNSLVIYTRLTCWKDPTSKFFQAENARVPNYSAYRIQEAKLYADSIATARQPQKSERRDPPELCIGVASVERKGILYLKSTLGSLQHGLSTEERARLHFVVLLAHTDQTNHVAYNQPWLDNMADELPSYSDNEERFALATMMENNSTHGIKAKFDYSIVVEECAKTGASEILMIEDDVVFMDGWWPRLRESLAVATAKTWELGHQDCKTTNCTCFSTRAPPEPQKEG